MTRVVPNPLPTQSARTSAPHAAVPGFETAMSQAARGGEQPSNPFPGSVATSSAPASDAVRALLQDPDTGAGGQNRKRTTTPFNASDVLAKSTDTNAANGATPAEDTLVSARRLMDVLANERPTAINPSQTSTSDAPVDPRRTLLDPFANGGPTPQVTEVVSDPATQRPQAGSVGARIALPNTSMETRAGVATPSGAMDVASGQPSPVNGEGRAFPSTASPLIPSDQLGLARSKPQTVAEAIARTGDPSAARVPLQTQIDPVRLTRAILSSAAQDNAGKPFTSARLDGGRDVPPPQVVRRETHFPVIQRTDPTSPPLRTPPDTLPMATQTGQGASPASPSAWYSFDRLAPQVFTALSGASGAAADGATTRLAPPPAITPSMAMGPVKVIEIALQPATLGSLTVTIRLSPSGLKVSVAATERETARTLSEDSAAMADLVKLAGYEVEEIDIAFAPVTAIASGTENSPVTSPSPNHLEVTEAASKRPAPRGEQSGTARSITV